MQNMERRKFEESWRDAFDQAEGSPSENVWTNIELDLEKEKGSHLKRRLLFYQSVAAACVIATMSIGMYVVSNTGAPEQLAKQQRVEFAEKNTLPSAPETGLNRDKNTISSASTSALTVEEDAVNAKTNSSASKTGLRASAGIRKVSPSQSIEGQSVSGGNESTDNTPPESESMLAAADEHNLEALFSPIPAEKLPVLAHIEEIELAIGREQPEPDPVVLMLARLDDRERTLMQEEEEIKEKNKDERMWTSFGIAAGSFNTVNSSASTTPPQGFDAQQPPSSFNGFQTEANNASVLASVAEKEAKASGITYSMGINVGTKISERWVIQGGVNYLAQSSDYTQQVLIGNQDNSQFRPAIYNDYRKTSLPVADAKPENLINTAPYDVNNNVRYLSIPVQAGYLIVNRDFGLQLNAGVSTDLFLQSTITATANGEKVDPSKADFGENSVFRPVNLSGLMGTEFSYKFGPHYRIALNPGIRYPFNSIYKSDDYNTTRITFDLGLRFRYIFH